MTCIFCCLVPSYINLIKYSSKLHNCYLPIHFKLGCVLEFKVLADYCLPLRFFTATLQALDTAYQLFQIINESVK